MGGIISGGDKATIEFTKQPKDVEVGVGGTATFTAEAKVKTSTSIGGILSKVYYIWVDADKTINESVIKELISGIIGDGNTSGDYSLENVQTTDNGKQLKCIAYGGTLINKTLTYAVSNTVTLTVTGGTADPDPRRAPIPPLASTKTLITSPIRTAPAIRILSTGIARIAARISPMRPAQIRPLKQSSITA